MRIAQDFVTKELPKIIKLPYCVITGDEPALMLNTEQKIKDAVMSSGEYERDVFDVDNKFDWSAIMNTSQSLSLFSTQKLIQLRFTNKPDAKTFKTLHECLDKTNPDLFYLITMPKLDGKTLKNKTLAMVERNGCLITIYPPDHTKLPNWIQNRARELHVNLSPEAVTFIAAHNEGNFLAIEQLLTQLSFLYGHQQISNAMIAELSSENSNFVAFDLSSALLTGDIARIYRIIQGLRSEGDVPTLVNWVLQKEIATLQKMYAKMDAGATMEMALNDVWQNQKPLYRSALNRMNPNRLRNLSSMVVQIDLSIKGQMNENPWNAIMRTAFAFAGKRLLPLSAEIKL